jgi:hypothetical protein
MCRAGVGIEELDREARPLDDRLADEHLRVDADAILPVHRILLFTTEKYAAPDPPPRIVRLTAPPDNGKRGIALVLKRTLATRESNRPPGGRLR